MKIIFDPGSCHFGNEKYAHELIDVVKETGADSIKWQLFKGSKNGNIELPRKWWASLLIHAKSINLDMFASVFDEEAIDLLHDSGITKIKLAYSQNFNLRLIRKARKLGMEIWASGDDSAYPDYADVQFYCKPEYPIKSLTDNVVLRFEDYKGFSSHWLGYRRDKRAMKHTKWQYLEKHITLDHDDIDVPDHWFALLPKEAKELVQCLKKTKESL